MLHPGRHLPVVVVGAGPAGLAVSHELAARGIEHVILEAGSVGESWRRYYDDLVLHTGKHLSALPGRPFRRSDPTFVPRARFVSYLEAYARTFALPVVEGVTVAEAHRADGAWVVRTSDDVWTSASLVVATGIASSPVIPPFPGRDRFQGRIHHSIDYRRPDDSFGRNVLVVGAGNSGAEIAAELGGAGVSTTISIRSGVVVVPRDIAGIPSQYIGYALRRLPRVIARPIVGFVTARRARRLPPALPRSDASPLDVLPLIGMHLPDAIDDGSVRVRPGVESFTERGVRFVDGSEAPFDEVILATGFVAAIGFLGPDVHRDGRGFARRSDRVASADEPALYFVGHEYDASGGLANIRRDAPAAARQVADDLARTGR